MMNQLMIDEALSGAQAGELLPDLGFGVNLLELGDFQTFTAFGLFFELLDGLELHKRGMSVVKSTEKLWVADIPSS